MKQIVSGWLSGLALVGLAWQAGAITSDGGANPYQTVVERNVFGLKPMPRPEDMKPPELPPPPNQVKLQGLSQLFGRRSALVKVTELPKPGQPPKEEAKVLYEGERWGAIEVLAIDMEARTVKLSNAGQVTNLALVDFIVKTAAPAAAAPGPVVPGVPRPTFNAPGMPMPRPAGATTVPGISGGSSFVPNMPARPVRTSSAAGFRSGIDATPSIVGQPQQQQPQLSLEEQIVLMEVERERNKAAVAAGELPPLPPTVLTPPGAAGIAPPQQPPGN